MHLSVVIPVYGCKSALPELHRRLVSSLEEISPDFEIILVNDACPQGSWEEVKRLAEEDARVVGIDLSRNFGQVQAITAGLEHARGDWVVVMDCDLQDQPEEILRLYEKAQEGWDAVFGVRAERHDRLLKRLTSWAFARVYTYLTGGAYDSRVCNFSISRRFVIANYLRMRELRRAWGLFVRWMGFRITTLDVSHAARPIGKSSYTMRKQFRLAGEIITAHSNRPLVLSIRLGLLMAAASFTYGLYLVIRKLFFGISIAGWTTTTVSVYLVGGLMLANLGMVGLYIGYIFDQTKARPLYIVREVVENQISKLGGRDP